MIQFNKKEEESKIKVGDLIHRDTLMGPMLVTSIVRETLYGIIFPFNNVAMPFSGSVDILGCTKWYGQIIIEN